MLFKTFKIFLISFLISYCWAESPFYEVVVDVGSTGSRVHIYSITASDKDLPNIEQVFFHSIEPGFSTYANDPNQIPFYLSRLFNPAQKFCYTEKLPCQDMPIYFLATAGMRLLPEQTQTNMYGIVRGWLKDNTLFGDVKETRTMSGEHEAAFGWLTAYEENILNKKPLGAFFELGGASMQYVFVVDKVSESNYIINLPNKTIYLNLGSWLGFGSNEAVNRVTKYWKNSDKLCYPKGFKSKNGFEYKSCFNLFRHYLTVNENPTTEKTAVQNVVNEKEPIIMTANFRTLFDFFGTLDPGKIHDQLKATCELDWKTLRQKNPLVDPKALGNFCVEGTYVMSLFEAFGLPSQYSNYHLPSSSWTRGLVLYHWTLSSDHLTQA
ncbi:MAG: hypothetical protein CMF41_00320 [Legionellales bacterium]|nr:hypothetical protein [Legionellales bacterium]OUX66486.1 MAG: hypothetical protein CBE41_00240 [Gammaproteobacteria bacterium TMED281]